MQVTLHTVPTIAISKPLRHTPKHFKYICASKTRSSEAAVLSNLWIHQTTYVLKGYNSNFVCTGAKTSDSLARSLTNYFYDNTEIKRVIKGTFRVIWLDTSRP